PSDPAGWVEDLATITIVNKQRSTGWCGYTDLLGKFCTAGEQAERIMIRTVPSFMAHEALRRHPELVSLFFILVAASLVSAPILFYGAPYGQDTIYHESWLRAFNSELSAGQWYPRWLHNLNGGAGSPGFFFYGPVPFYIAALFDKLICPS